MIDQIALVTVSGEVMTNIYYHLKRVSPLTSTIMVTLANDRIGYIADDAAYDTPIFEVNGTPVARGCAENGIVNGLVDMINRRL
jgi:neutral ceramidase